jgi:hypothetical protein
MRLHHCVMLYHSLRDDAALHLDGLVLVANNTHDTVIDSCKIHNAHPFERQRYRLHLPLSLEEA